MTVVCSKRPLRPILGGCFHGPRSASACPSKESLQMETFGIKSSASLLLLVSSHQHWQAQ